MNTNSRKGWELFSGLSRNFYHASRMFLPGDIKDENMIFYLMFKIADTIEDSRMSIDNKKKCFDRFRHFLPYKKNDMLTSEFVKEFKDVPLAVNERNLIDSTRIVLDLFYKISYITRLPLNENITRMTYGMEEYLEKRIRNFSDQDNYCHYVAGLVGRSLTDLYFISSHIDKKQYKSMVSLADGFGLLLQKVNIIRGIKEDYIKSNENEANRIYIPEELLNENGLSLDRLFVPQFREEALSVLETLVKDAEKYAEKPFEYIAHIPKREIGIRMFSNVMLLTSLALLNKCRDNYEIFERDEEINLSKHERLIVLMKSLYN